MKKKFVAMVFMTLMIVSTNLFAAAWYSRAKATWSAVDPRDENDTYTATWTNLTDWYAIGPRTVLISREAQFGDGDPVFRLLYTYGRINMAGGNGSFYWHDWDFRYQAERYPSTAYFWDNPDYKGNYIPAEHPDWRRYYAYSWHQRTPYSEELYDGHSGELQIGYIFNQGQFAYYMRFNYDHDVQIIE